MNERDYTFIQYFSIFTVIVIVSIWHIFAYIYNIQIKPTDYVIVFLMLNLGLWISFIAYFKKNKMIQEMKEEINKYSEK